MNSIPLGFIVKTSSLKKLGANMRCEQSLSLVHWVPCPRTATHISVWSSLGYFAACKHHIGKVTEPGAYQSPFVAQGGYGYWLDCVGLKRCKLHTRQRGDEYMMIHEAEYYDDPLVRLELLQ